MEQQANNSIIVQSNKLVEARYSLTVTEQRLITYLLSFIHPDDKDFKDYEINIIDFMNTLGLTHKNTYGKINEVTQSLINRPLHIPKKSGGFINAAWLASADYDEGKGSVKLAFAPVLKPYLLQLKREFTKYRLFVVVHFQSQHSIRIYMLLKQYESIGVREFTLDEIKKILGIEDNYPRFQDFKNWVLRQAKKEFEKKDDNGNYLCDLTFDFESIKTGRKITGIRFIIKKQSYKNVLELPKTEVKETKDASACPTSFESVPNSPLLAKLKGFGITQTKATQWLQHYGESYLTDKLVLLKKTLQEYSIKNPAGWLYKAIEQDYQDADVIREQQEALARKAEEEKREREKEEERQRFVEERQKRDKERLRKSAEQAVKKLFLMEHSEEEQAGLLEQLKTKHADMAMLMTSWDSAVALGLLPTLIPNYHQKVEDIIQQSQ